MHYFITAIIVHVILHWWYYAHLKSAPAPAPACGYKIITQNKLFHRLAFTLQGIIVNIQAAIWLQKGSEAAEILVTCAQLWIMMYALLSLFSCWTLFLICRKTPCRIAITAKGIFRASNSSAQFSSEY